MTKWALLLIGILSVGLAGWWLWSSLSSNTPNDGQRAPDGTQFPIQDVPYTPRSGQNGSQAQSSSQSPDITAAFASLFSQVGATSVTMVKIDAASSGDSAAIYALYAGDVAISKEIYPKDSSYPMHVAFVDLNEDGTSEAIVYEDLPGFCGTVGCALDIYQKRAGTWSKIFDTVVQGEIGLLNVYVNSYRSLLLTTSAGGSQSNAVPYAWDGKVYQPGTVVAAWDGTTFILSQ